MHDFDIDSFKKTWQEQKVPQQYNSSEILGMLNKKSRNYVKYILWISIAELFVMLLMNAYYIFYGDDSSSFLNLLTKLGVEKNADIEKNFAHIYFIIKVISIVITAGFVYLFFNNYQKINVEENLKKFITQIMRFKKTVNGFIFMNIALLVIFTIVLAIFAMSQISAQHVVLEKPESIIFIVGTIVMIVICILLFLLYYRIVYGIIMRRLSKNLEQLQKIESEE